VTRDPKRSPTKPQQTTSDYLKRLKPQTQTTRPSKPQPTPQVKKPSVPHQGRDGLNYLDRLKKTTYSQKLKNSATTRPENKKNTGQGIQQRLTEAYSKDLNNKGKDGLNLNDKIKALEKKERGIADSLNDFDKKYNRKKAGGRLGLELEFSPPQVGGRGVDLGLLGSAPMKGSGGEGKFGDFDVDPGMLNQIVNPHPGGGKNGGSAGPKNMVSPGLYNSDGSMYQSQQFDRMINSYIDRNYTDADGNPLPEPTPKKPAEVEVKTYVIAIEPVTSPPIESDLMYTRSEPEFIDTTNNGNSNLGKNGYGLFVPDDKGRRRAQNRSRDVSQQSNDSSKKDGKFFGKTNLCSV
jgi:hypothetical protein